MSDLVFAGYLILVGCVAFVIGMFYGEWLCRKQEG